MNTYETTFVRQCPVNGLLIIYRLQIRSPGPIMVEDILQVIKELPTEGYHEAFADLLAAKLPGHHTMRAYHHGVDITTERGGA